ncbi:putative polyketide synthase [Xylaria curta]|nr:putative polyketide synthase [Xylaria curta]
MSPPTSPGFILPNGETSHTTAVCDIEQSHSLFTSAQGTENRYGPKQNDDPICVVGMACRLPGNVHSPADLWTFLMDGKSGQGRVPSERFNIDGFYHADDSKAGVISANGGYFLNEDVRQFDNSFFGINNLEAAYMDPHQRKLLEVTYECFESAGLSMNDVSGSNIGVYVSNFTVDYTTMNYRDPDYLHRYSATGSGMAIIANRISHVFNLQGPSLVLNTACSSSLYCLNTAARALAAGDCDAAIVAGANLILSPEQHLGTMKSGVLSPTSTCHTFDESADGYGRAEGVNAVYLKRLSSALRDGDKIWGVIRATSVNSNGKTTGISQPSASLQEAVIRKAYSEARLSMADTDYIECHGTGTSVGDVVEIEALGRCFAGRTDHPLLIGSVKTNLGHSEAASGLTSLIKVLLAFQSRIPPTIGIKSLNPKLPLESFNMKVVTSAEEWPRSLRRASINSFGYGGANSHTIVESLDSYLNRLPLSSHVRCRTKNQRIVLPVSANSQRSLEKRVAQISNLIQDEQVSPESLALSLTQPTLNFRHRQILIAEMGGNGEWRFNTSAASTATVANGESLPFAFVFTGQGAQYAGMARELLLHNEAFLATIRELDQTLQMLPSNQRPTWTLEKALVDVNDSRINEVAYSQPLSTAIQIGLVDILRSWGVSPSAVVGHSSGEIAAAYAAGLLTASQSIVVSYLRGYAVSQITMQGSMIAAGIDNKTAQQLIIDNGLQEEVQLACINDASNVTLSGSQDGIDILLEKIQHRQSFVRKLTTAGRAYHSHMMREIGAYYEELIAPFLVDAEIPEREARIPMFSSVDYGNGLISRLEVITARYWRENLERPVQFLQAFETLANTGDYHSIEVGPHHALKGSIQRIQAGMAKHSSRYSATLVKGRDAHLALLSLAGELFTHGHRLIWQQVNGNSPGPRHDPLPPYPWDYSAGTNCYEPRSSIDLRNRKHPRHELLGSKQLAGDGINWCWRNILSLSEIPWVRDHTIEGNIVFPGAAYLATAMEAINQVKSLRRQDVTYEFSKVKFITALVLQDRRDGETIGAAELLTTMSPRELSTDSTSLEWYDFSISSWTEGQATVNCTGSIRTEARGVLKETVRVLDTAGYETSLTDRWYQKLEADGLEFGPQFRTVTRVFTDGNRARGDSVSTTRLPIKLDSSTDYALHPVSIDSCFQAGIFATAQGTASSLKAQLPVLIDECRISGSGGSEGQASIDAQSSKIGATTCVIDCTFRDSRGSCLVDMKGVRVSLYTGKTSLEQNTAPTNIYDERNPCLRIRWKPDIMRLYEGNESHIKSYVDDFVLHQHSDFSDDHLLGTISALVDLAGHKIPGMRVLELGSDCQCKSKRWLDLLGKDRALQRLRDWVVGCFQENGDIAGLGETEGPFDMVIIPERIISEQYWREFPNQILSQVKGDHGIIICRKTPEAMATLRGANFTAIEMRHDVILAVRETRVDILSGKPVVILHREYSAAIQELLERLSERLHAAGASAVRYVSLRELSDFQLEINTVCISVLEIEREFFASMNQHDMDLFRIITEKVQNLVWLTTTNTLGQSNPRLTLSSGLSRALALEQPALRFSVVDIGHPDIFKQNLDGTCTNLLSVFEYSSAADDKEFIESAGMLHISRFYPDVDLNARFRRRVGSYAQEKLRKLPLAAAAPLRLSIGILGNTDTLHFQQTMDPPRFLRKGFVELELKAVGLTVNDFHALNGRADRQTRALAHQFSGVITAIGEEVMNLRPGDRVVGMSPIHFSTIEQIPAWAVQKLLPDEDFTTTSAIPLAYSTALYTLHVCARVQKGESLLIHGGTGATIMAFLDVSRNMETTVFVTVDSEAKREFLVNEQGVQGCHILSVHDPSFVDKINASTGGQGVDAIFNSFTGDVKHASWKCLARFGRFVDLSLSARGVTNAEKLDTAVFQRNVSLTAFDENEMFSSFGSEDEKSKAFLQNLEEALGLYRSGFTNLNGLKVFDLADIAKAYRYIASPDGQLGQAVVSLENPNALLQVAEPTYHSLLSAEKVYILVGCLGGLGRSLSRWMVSRGARHFVFLGRSGCDKSTARNLISSLQSAGANTTVVKGDVMSSHDVKRTVESALMTGRPIGGVVQAAMDLSEGLFSHMTSESWHQGIDAKWVGTWNMHTALEGYDDALDFFLMTSSVSGSIGIATQSNYCAPNCFLDAFARWRREQGKPAISVGLGMIAEVGYLHEHPDVENILLRKGIRSLNEDEFLQIIDFALSDQSGNDKDPAEAHILTGLELFGFRSLLAKGFDMVNLPIQDPRAALLAEALEAGKLADDAGKTGLKSYSVVNGDINNTANLADELSKLHSGLLSDEKAGLLRETISREIRKRFSDLILMPIDQVEDSKPLTQFGVDSMTASEFRTWIWSTFRVDIPFFELLSNQTTLKSLAGAVKTK